MQYFVVSYPKLLDVDDQWIISVRAHFPKLHFSPLPFHVTFVFPTEGIEPNNLIDHVQGVCKTYTALPLIFRCCIPVKDVSSIYTYVFLIPDEGFSAVVRLHDQLYSGLLLQHLRLDIPFIPHMTIGFAEDPNLSKAVADYANSKPFQIRGSIQTLEVVSKDKDRYSTLAQIDLHD